jgi:hypothetical protein
MDHIAAAERSWRNSEFVCTFADTERHLGHLIKTEKWLAYDATHSSDSLTGFKHLGAFVDLETARQAVESSVARARLTRALGAAGSFT